MKKLTICFVVAFTACAFSACNGKTSSTAGQGTDSVAATTQRNKQAAIRIMTNFVKRRDYSNMFRNVAPGFVDYGSGDAKPETNLDSLRANVKDFLTAFPDLNIENIVAIAQGDTVVVLCNWTGTFKGTARSMKPTGKSFKIFDADIFTFNKNGKLTSHKSTVPIEDYLSQAGVDAPSPKP
jgi:predicted ester cyclase